MNRALLGSILFAAIVAVNCRPELVGCSRPSGWCYHEGSTYSFQDCDGDGISDHTCSDTTGQFGVLQSSNGCADNWPIGVCLDCQFVHGDGNGSEGSVGKTISANECMSKVRKEHPEANGATWGVLSGSRPGDCYYEVGATGSNKDEGKWITCIIRGKCTFALGDISGTDWHRFGSTTTDDECYKVVKMSKHGSQASAAKRKATNGKCYAYFGPARKDNNSDVRSCIFGVPTFCTDSNQCPDVCQKGICVVLCTTSTECPVGASCNSDGECQDK